MKRLVLLCLSLVACRNSSTTATAPADAAPAPSVVASTSASVAASASAAAPKAPEGTRIQGPVNGGFAVDRLQFLAGAPIIVTFLATNTGSAPLAFDVGGDAGTTLMPLRYGLIVKDPLGVEVCNTSKSPPATVGGLATTVTLKPNERFRDKIAINGACEALLTPGKYTATLVRRLDAQIGKDAGTCDDLSPTETVPSTASPACKALLESAPLIASDVSFEVVAYDQKELAKGLEPFVAEAKKAKDVGEHPERLAYFQWLCRRVTCNCSAPKTAAELATFMSAVSDKLPASIPAKCP